MIRPIPLLILLCFFIGCNVAPRYNSLVESRLEGPVKKESIKTYYIDSLGTTTDSLLNSSVITYSPEGWVKTIHFELNDESQYAHTYTYRWKNDSAEVSYLETSHDSVINEMKGFRYWLDPHSYETRLYNDNRLEETFTVKLNHDFNITVYETMHYAKYGSRLYSTKSTSYYQDKSQRLPNLTVFKVYYDDSDGIKIDTLRQKVIETDKYGNVIKVSIDYNHQRRESRSTYEYYD
ncbi:hypothetical protein COR50_04920 [Chitinophaga caeni]|uniref:Uncharacterized protein n=1 Tax=Chitinophaga caeni TaxID=2029983 RepID=A0A291QRV8_9BACT|nr:hypothetical protein [Chitinophaga caeni]ATL46574.1 hypothetical protein COR50_04920 [Chitinophaga caeni]